MLLDALKTSLLLVDVQERLLPAVANSEDVERRCGILVKAAKALAMPVTVSEQYSKGLGHTVPGLRVEIGNAPVLEKLTFSCWRDGRIKAEMIRHHDTGRPLVIVAGIEAHVGVLQTCIDLANAGFGVFAAADAMSSRHLPSVSLAQDRMRQAGVQIVNTEMVIFELLGRDGTAESQALSALVR